jgi:hypothetical protein
VPHRMTLLGPFAVIRRRPASKYTFWRAPLAFAGPAAYLQPRRSQMIPAPKVRTDDVSVIGQTLSIRAFLLPLFAISKQRFATFSPGQRFYFEPLRIQVIFFLIVERKLVSD